jgi:AbrB family looped-hinge helix DNA binding protein
MTRKGQVTIPVHIRRKLGLKASDRVAFIESEGRVEIAPARSVTERTAGALKRYSHSPAVSRRQESEGFEQAVAEEVAASRAE